MIKCGTDYDSAFGSQWRDDPLYIGDEETPATEYSVSFELQQFDFGAPQEVQDAQPTTLQDQLLETLQSRDHPEGRRFFPGMAFTEVVNKKAVQDELRCCFRSVDSAAIERLANIVCGPVPLRKVFALLALVEKVTDIENFIREGVTDDVLPLRKVSQPGAVVFQLGRLVPPHGELRPLQCVEGWNSSVMWMFEDWQWATLAPVFQGGERKNVYHVDLESRAPLPFLSDSRHGLGSETIRGGYSTVFKVKLHPDHHTFRNSKVCLSTHSIYCVSKQLIHIASSMTPIKVSPSNVFLQSMNRNSNRKWICSEHFRMMRTQT